VERLTEASAAIRHHRDIEHRREPPRRLDQLGHGEERLGDRGVRAERDRLEAFLLRAERAHRCRARGGEDARIRPGCARRWRSRVAGVDDEVVKRGAHRVPAHAELAHKHRLRGQHAGGIAAAAEPLARRLEDLLVQRYAPRSHGAAEFIRISGQSQRRPLDSPAGLAVSSRCAGTARRIRMRLKDKVALVTGAQQGIGRAVAVALAREGAHVAVNYLDDRAAASKVVDEARGHGVRAVALPGDVALPEDVTAMAAAVERELGRVDILVNNAGIFPRVPFLATGTPSST
jgi:short chain dehydrogenase